MAKGSRSGSRSDSNWRWLPENHQKWIILASALVFLASSMAPSFCPGAKSENSDFAQIFRSLLPADTSQSSGKDSALAVLKQIANGTYPGQSSWNLLATLHKEHPRLLVLDSDLPAVQSSIKADPVARELYDKLTTRAESMLSEPPAAYIVVEGDILRQSRNALKRICT